MAPIDVGSHGVKLDAIAQVIKNFHAVTPRMVIGNRSRRTGGTGFTIWCLLCFWAQ